jgi:putative transposase
MNKERALYFGYRFPREIISHCVWLYFRFPLSYRDVQEMMAERGIAISHEAIRNWCEKFGREYSRRIRIQRGRLGDTWHLDEVFVRIDGQIEYLWRAVDQEGNLLDVLVQAKRDKKAASRFFRKVLKGAGYAPRVVVTDRLASYREPCAHLVSGALHVRDKGANNRAENSHQPTRIRERRMKRFKSIVHAQRFLSIFGSIYDLFSVGRHHLKAKHFRILMANRFGTWRRLTQVAPAAI